MNTHATLKSHLSNERVLASHQASREVSKTWKGDMRLHFSESLDFWVTFMSVHNYLVPTHTYVRLMVKHLAGIKPSVFREEDVLLKILTYSSIIFEIQILVSNYTAAMKD